MLPSSTRPAKCLPPYDDPAPLSDPATRARIEAALAPFAHAAHVTLVTDPYRTQGQISHDGHIAFATVQFGVPSAKISNAEAKALMHDATAASGHGLRFSLGGDVVDLAETPYGGPSEGAGAAAAAVVLLIAFGSFLAMGWLPRPLARVLPKTSPPKDEPLAADLALTRSAG